MAVGIAVFLIYSAIRYHRKSENELGSQTRYNIPIEAAWTVIPFFFFMGFFVWGAKLYFDIERPPDNAISMYVVGKQWMWKVQHPEGQREINELHIPVGRPVKLTMTSEDVIHSFFVPAFRTKQDVLPGRYTTDLVRSDKPGKYHLFCCRVLRHETFGNDRLDLCDDPGRLSELADARRGGRLARIGRRKVLSSVWLRQLSSLWQPRPLSGSS